MIEKSLLLELKKRVEPKAIFWNQNSLFLVFGFAAAILLTTGIELFKIIAKDYLFNLTEVSKNIFTDWYLFGILLFFLFGLFVSIVVTRIIDENKNHFNDLLKLCNKELNKK